MIDNRETRSARQTARTKPLARDCAISSCGAFDKQTCSYSSHFPRLATVRTIVSKASLGGCCHCSQEKYTRNRNKRETIGLSAEFLLSCILQVFCLSFVPVASSSVRFAISEAAHCRDEKHDVEVRIATIKACQHTAAASTTQSLSGQSHQSDVSKQRYILLVG